MSQYLYDGSIEGLLTALATALEQEKGAADFISSLMPGTQLVFDAIHVETAPEKADQFLADLRKRSEDSVQYMFRVFMTEEVGMLPILFEYLKLVREMGAQANHYYVNAAVKQMHACARKVGGEIHRLKGLLRFRQLEDGTYWGPIEPDYNVTYAVAPYFTRRMRDQNWIIHDVRRNLAAVWRRHKLNFGPAPEILPVQQAEGLPSWETLWQTYFKCVAIPERINPRLQRQNMPSRYWKYLVEKPQIGRK
jgi:probable DNA metabolism protein